MAPALSAAARDTVERVCLNYRDWAPGEAQPPHLAGVLPGGQSNLSLLLAGADRRWVLRVPRDERPGGVCHRREFRIHALAAAHSLAPAIAWADAATGLLVTRYLPQSNTLQSHAPQAIAELLRGVHALPMHDLSAPAQGIADDSGVNGNRSDFDVLEPAAELAQLRRELGDTDPLLGLRRTAADGLKTSVSRTGHNGVAAVICHNDLLRANRLVDDDRLIAIDWEYARPGDPFFDLAVVASQLDGAQRRALLEAYLQRPPSEDENERLMNQLRVYLALAACWYARYGEATQAKKAVERLLLLTQASTRNADGRA